MAIDATLNARIDRDLKRRGDAVLTREGVSVSKAIRKLYQHIDQNQSLPSWMLDDSEIDEYEQRREGIRSLVGAACLSEGLEVNDLKRERLAHQEF